MWIKRVLPILTVVSCECSWNYYLTNAENHNDSIVFHKLSGHDAIWSTPEARVFVRDITSTDIEGFLRGTL